jgi:4-hydroxy-tetrahydrodipicolinate synthase
MMKNAIFAGVNAAVLTPVRDNLSPDLDRMATHCRWLLANGCNGLGILGTTGEANSLGVAQRVEIMEGLAERGIAPATLMPGTGTPALADTVFLTQRAQALGCKGVLVLPPFFYKNPTEDGLFAYFSELVNRIGAGIRIYLYHFPQQSAVPITLSLIARLLKTFPGIIKGAKDSSGDFANTSAMVHEFGQDGFEVYGADDGRLQDLLRIGGAGCITAAGNVNSTVAAQVYADWNGPAGAEAQIVLAATRKAVTSVPLIAGLKALVARRTGDEAWNNILPPNAPLSPADAKMLFTAFDASGINIKMAA